MKHNDRRSLIDYRMDGLICKPIGLGLGWDNAYIGSGSVGEGAGEGPRVEFRGRLSK